MGDFDEAATWPIEQGVGFGASFDCARFPAVRSQGHQVLGQSEQQILPELAAHFVSAGLSHGGVKGVIKGVKL